MKKLGLGIAAMLLAAAVFFYVNIPTWKEEVFSFPSVYGEKAVTLEGSRWYVDDAEYAVLICPGYSCDRQKWRPFADLFVANGFTTMVFDYAGQGASSSSIGFDNAKTDAIPEEIDDALEVLHEWSGIDYDHIILMGHSMGGRAILRLLADYNREGMETKTSAKEIGAAILFSPEVNCEFNAQASLFAGTSDDVEEPWASFTGADVKGTDIYLYGSTADDIVSDENILSIFSHLGGADAPESGTYAAEQVNEWKSKLQVGITSGVLHSYQMYSPKFAAFANQALTDISGKTAEFNPTRMSLIYVGWLLALLGLGLTLAGLTQDSVKADETKSLGNRGAGECVPKLLNPGKFLLFKLLMWIPGLLAAFLICCITVVMPFGSPVMNTPYMCCIAGYGLVMLLAYRKGRFAGTEGRLPKMFAKRTAFSKDKGAAIIVSLLLCAFVWYVLRASMYRLIPLNARLFWVTFAGILMTVGYYVSGCEADMLRQAGVSWRVRIGYNLIQYVALFLLVLFYLAIGSYSGLIGQVQNLILMYIFCIPLGEYLKQRMGSRLVGAFVSGFVFQTLMITSAALIAIF